MGLLTGKALGHFLHGGHTGHTTHEHELVDIAGAQTGSGNALAHGAGGALQQSLGKLLQPAAGQRELDVLGTGGIHGDERQGDVVALRGGEGNLGLLCLFLDALQGVRLLGDVHTLAALEFCQNPVDDSIVPVITTQVGVTVGSLHLEHTVADFQHGDIEGTTTKVIHGNLLVATLVQAVSQSSGGGFVDDAAHLQTGNFTGSLGGVTLSIVEVSGHGNHSLGDGLAQLGFGICLQLAKNHGADFLGGVHLGLATHFHLNVGVAVGGFHDGIGNLLVVLSQLSILAADETLGGEHRVAGVGHSLALGSLAYDTLAVLGECDDGRSGTCALAVLENSSLTAFHDSHAGVRSTKVNTEYFAHGFVSFYVFVLDFLKESGLRSCKLLLPSSVANSVPTFIKLIPISSQLLIFKRLSYCHINFLTDHWHTKHETNCRIRTKCRTYHMRQIAAVYLKNFAQMLFSSLSKCI